MIVYRHSIFIYTAQVALMVRNPPANAGDIRDASSIPGLGRSSGEGNGNPLQDSCLENSMDREAWRTTVHGFTKNGHDLSDLACICVYIYICMYMYAYVKILKVPMSKLYCWEKVVKHICMWKI